MCVYEITEKWCHDEERVGVLLVGAMRGILVIKGDRG